MIIKLYTSLIWNKKEKEIKIKNKIKIQYNLLIKNQKLSVTTL